MKLNRVEINRVEIKGCLPVVYGWCDDGTFHVVHHTTPFSTLLFIIDYHITQNHL